MDKARDWFGPISGILFVVTVVIRGALVGELNIDPSDSTSSVLAELGEKADDIFAGVWIAMLGVGFLLIFLAHFRTKFRDSGVGWAADAFLAGGVVLAGALTVIGAVQLAGAEAGDRGHAEAAQGVVDFLWNSILIFSPGLLAVGLAAAVVSFAYRALPTWLGAFAVLVALGALAPWVGIFVFVAWVLAASIVEIIHVSRPSTAADAT